jgi:hypothetical protein
MKTFAAIALFAALLSAPAKAQKLNLNFDEIAKKAKDKTELSLEGPLLDMLKQTVLKSADKEKQALFAGIDQISIHSYEFAKPGEYADSDLDPLRKQMANAAGWSRMLNVKEKDEDTQIYVLMQGDKPAGFVLIAAEAEELTVIQVAGSIQLAKLEELVNSTVQFKELARQ